MKVILHLVDGRTISVEDVNNISIEEEYFQNQITEQTTDVPGIPTEGRWFMVKPLAINQNLFKDEREDFKQEKIRQYILEAFEEMKKNPKYTRDFKTMNPKKTWDEKSVGELKKLAKNLGDHNANWVEQALEWAQIIANGESWEKLCNERDTSNWYRLVVWKDGFARLVGGSCIDDFYDPISDVDACMYNDDEVFKHTVPKVVSYDVHY